MKYNFNQLKVGQAVEALKRKQVLGSASDAEQVDENTAPIKGRVVAINDQTMDVTIRTPEGIDKAINWIEFIVRILPLIDKILLWVLEKVEQFKQRRKNKSNDDKTDEGKSQVTPNPSAGSQA